MADLASSELLSSFMLCDWGRDLANVSQSSVNEPVHGVTRSQYYLFRLSKYLNVHVDGNDWERNPFMRIAHLQ